MVVGVGYNGGGGVEDGGGDLEKREKGHGRKKGMGDIEAVKVFLHDKFTIKNIEEAKYFVGVQIAKSVASMYLTHTKYIINIIKDLKLEECTAVATPLQVDWQAHDPNSRLMTDSSTYRRLISRLLYLDFT
ncbi:hypothetical protein LIER_36030 [Lithospermum erythrorhizon]|uniref:Reverse transcriptase Ty1/copia-type domain-containing protein n=1 Tax=Lithospermum erythrorhizon TaxID=34254 RepID=A0AAV3P4E0_LITER